MDCNGLNHYLQLFCERELLSILFHCQIVGALFEIRVSHVSGLQGVIGEGER